MQTFTHLFALRPSVVCNFSCKYCYRQDFMGERQHLFDIDAMLWHATTVDNNLFNFCGYGETMIHPQFSDMIIELSKVTHVCWVTNGTQFGCKFDNILRQAKHSNILNVIISVHPTEIKNLPQYSLRLRRVRHDLANCGIESHVTSILTDANVDQVLYARRYIPDLVIKHPFDIYSVGGSIISHSYNDATLRKLVHNGIEPKSDGIYGNQLIPPYTGKTCLNGHQIFEVMHDGLIYDCSFDNSRVVIGDINRKIAINNIASGRVCRSDCVTCIPILRNAYGLVR